MTSGGPLHYSLPDQGKPVDEALLLQEASCSESLILIGDFKHPDVYWKTTWQAASHPGESWNVLRIISWFRYSTGLGQTLVDLVFTNTEDLIKAFKIGSSLGCSSHAVVKFVILRNVDLAKSGVRSQANCLRNCWMRSPEKLSLET